MYAGYPAGTTRTCARYCYSVAVRLSAARAFRVKGNCLFIGSIQSTLGGGGGPTGIGWAEWGGWADGGIGCYRCLNKQDVNSLCHGPRRKQVIRCVVAGSTFELLLGIKGTVSPVPAFPPSSFPSLADCVPFAQTSVAYAPKPLY